MRRWVGPAIMLTVVGMWAVGMIVDMRSTEYELDPFVHSAVLAVLAIVGAIFGVRRNGRNGE